ncbi:LuxR C-terminal-related transcriptional regulator [Pseudomonas tohonis]|uniref:LuxR C-terminal-related transcriptional regulator n=1 Tax=Pseudomonas tohonis TaxID=2725477 RepID=UPI0021D8DCCA|nr:LuxR C-terminal-related transcriptional regulator [Pseudomonas tohonis]UXY52880.1 LuxR C-terminal-related transcriptional regulator [Pseudomonas tohonis]
MPRSSSGVPSVRAPHSSIPRLPPAHVPRPRLTERLLAEQSRLRLLCAPAGFGKSVLFSELLLGLRDPGQVLWLNLAGQPLHPEQLIAQIAGALQRPVPDLPAPLALLQLLDGGGKPLWLVLDDYPSQPPAELDACIDQLLARALPNLQLLVSARQRPDWNLPRLLLAGELQELDATHLALTRDELERLVDQLAPQASDAQREELWQESEGWCAGARLQLSSRNHPHGPGTAAAASHCWLKEYLDHELLARLGDEEARCLFALVHLPKVSAELCRQLWEESDGAELFSRLLARQAFCMPLDEDGHWYRVLPAVAKVLRNRISATAAAHLHLAACRVFIAAGQVEDAIEQALCAGQPEVAANYLEHLGQEWLTGEQHLAHLLAWRSRLPPLLLESTPRLLTLNAWALLLAWRLDEAEDCIHKLGRFLPQADARRNRKLLANWQALHGVLGALRGRPGQDAALHCQQALEHLPERDWMPILLCHSALARIAMASGQPDLAPVRLHDALEIARRQGSLLFETLINLDRTRLLLLRGEFARAQGLVTQSFALIGQRKAVDGLLLGRLHLIQGELHLIHGRLDDAETELRIGLEQALECADPFALHGYLGLAELRSRRGEFDQAFVHLRDAEREMHCRQVWRLSFNGVLSLQSMRVLARQQRWDRVEPVGLRIQRYFEGDSPWMPPLDYPTLPLRNLLLLARGHLAAGRAEQAEAMLRPLLQRCEFLQYRPLACEVGLALAEAARWLGQEDAANLEREARQQATHLGMQGLLQEWPTAGQTGERSGTAGAGDHSNLLSQRERSVLQLLAEGFSNQEIGSYLFISVNTVKTHTKKINSKLGVKRRTQAVMRAKSLGLLV